MTREQVVLLTETMTNPYYYATFYELLTLYAVHLYDRKDFEDYEARKTYRLTPIANWHFNKEENNV